MRFELLRRAPGLPHSFEEDRLLASRGNTLVETTDLGVSWRAVGRISGGVWAVHSRLRLAERLLRRSISHAFRTPAGSMVAIANRHIYRRGPSEARFEPVMRLERGSRPMHRGLCLTARGELYVGEYFRNPDRESVRIWCSGDDARTWKVAYTFPPGSVRHVHAIQEDPYRPGDIWVLCGDLGDEARILRTSDGFETVDCLGFGDQTWRATSALFTPEAVFYGMDSPVESSQIYRWERSSGRRSALATVDAPIYYGYRNAAGAMAFGTTTEPGPAVRDEVGRIWASEDGRAWQPVVELQKDRWPHRWFQYGCFFFPDGVGPENVLVFGTVGLSPHDGYTVIGLLLPGHAG